MAVVARKLKEGDSYQLYTVIKKEKTMPCRVEPTASELQRKDLNRAAESLQRWLDSKLGTVELDATGKLCATINNIGESEFLDLMAKSIREPEARKLLGWWEEHKEYDLNRRF